MAARDARPSQSPSHVAVFPPATRAGVFLETWPDAKPARPVASPVEISNHVTSREEEDPERWDGMS